jgi:hypothetical protein
MVVPAVSVRACRQTSASCGTSWSETLIRYCPELWLKLSTKM